MNQSFQNPGTNFNAAIYGISGLLLCFSAYRFWSANHAPESRVVQVVEVPITQTVPVPSVSNRPTASVTTRFSPAFDASQLMKMDMNQIVQVLGPPDNQEKVQDNIKAKKPYCSMVYHRGDTRLALNVIILTGGIKSIHVNSLSGQQFDTVKPFTDMVGFEPEGSMYSILPDRWVRVREGKYTEDIIRKYVSSRGYTGIWIRRELAKPEDQNISIAHPSTVSGPGMKDLTPRQHFIKVNSLIGLKADEIAPKIGYPADNADHPHKGAASSTITYSYDNWYYGKQKLIVDYIPQTGEVRHFFIPVAVCKYPKDMVQYVLSVSYIPTTHAQVELLTHPTLPGQYSGIKVTPILDRSSVSKHAQNEA